MRHTRLSTRRSHHARAPSLVETAIVPGSDAWLQHFRKVGTGSPLENATRIDSSAMIVTCSTCRNAMGRGHSMKALVIIDMQRWMFRLPERMAQAPRLVSHIDVLIGAFQRARLPIFDVRTV